MRTISLFGEVWGIGPATALKLYEKGHRTLDDLKNDDSLTHAQRLGLKYFDDIRTRIPRHEVSLLCFAGTSLCILEIVSFSLKKEKKKEKKLPVCFDTLLDYQAQEMELILKKTAEDILPGVSTITRIISLCIS